MVADLETDYADFFTQILQNGNLEDFSPDAYVNETPSQVILRYLIVILLADLFPEIEKPELDLHAHKQTLFDEVLLSIMNNKWHSLEGLSYLEKLIACNLSFIFKCSEPTFVGKVAKSLGFTFSERGHVMTKFLLKEEEVRTDAYLLLGYNLVDLVTRNGFLGCKGSIKELYYERIEEMEKSFETDLSILTEVIYLISRDLPLDDVDWSVEVPCLTLDNYKESGFNLLTAFTGSNRGIGSIAFEEVQIITFGPQIGEIGQSNTFGIDYLTNDQNHKIVAIDENRFDSRGWSRPSGSKDVWVEHHFKKFNEKFELIVSYEVFSSILLELSEIFYVTADEIRADGKIVKKGSLNRHKFFKKSVEIVLKNEVVKIELNSDALCQIIPLAGGSYYWAADFMIGFELEQEKEKQLHLTFSKNYL